MVNTFPLAEIYITFYSIIARNAFSKVYVDHLPKYKANLNKILRVEFKHNIFADHGGIELESYYKNVTRKFINFWKLNITH